MEDLNMFLELLKWHCLFSVVLFGLLVFYMVAWVLHFTKEQLPSLKEILSSEDVDKIANSPRSSLVKRILMLFPFMILPGVNILILYLIVSKLKRFTKVAMVEVVKSGTGKDIYFDEEEQKFKLVVPKDEATE